MRSATVLLVLCGLLATALADVYLHNPRGSNNRYRGDTNNQNRLFDSQNNNNGGYGWGPRMTYYAGSLLQVEWTAQHGCGPEHPNNDCELILQYMCGPWVRDGTRDDTAPNNIDTLSPTEQLEYGYHETVQYFRDCNNRQRNKGLFIADQNIGESAVNTRQNDGGNRRGFECDEERDYYPYWHPTFWRDIAVLTSGPIAKRCNYYARMSQNVTPKGMCVTPQAPAFNFDWNNWQNVADLFGYGAVENNQDACERNGNKWVVVPAWGIPPPECAPAPFTRDNHLGNSDQGTAAAYYRWIIPSVPFDSTASDNLDPSTTCVFRLRYNISSEDYRGYGPVDGTGDLVDFSKNGEVSPVRGNPTVRFGKDADGNWMNLTLAIDTSQFGRTFQDRSHTFTIKPRPAGISPAAKIWNLNVRGRRGNIVQAYPAVEYDFVPNTFSISVCDFIHPQWTGSDTQPGGQAGNGRDGTDRSNMVELRPTPDSRDWRRTNYAVADLTDQRMFANADDAYRLAHLGQGPVCNDTCQLGCCRTRPQQDIVANGGCPNVPDNGQNRDNQIQNCYRLNLAQPYFDGGLISMCNAGTFHYMGTRNNAFTNRSQKGSLYVSTKVHPVALASVIFGAAAFAGAAVIGAGVWYAKTHTASAAANIFGGLRV